MDAFQRTWKIRDQMPDGKWGPEREVTIEQFLADNAAKAAAAREIFRRNSEGA